MIADTPATINRLRPTDSTAAVLVRADSAFYGHRTVCAALRGGAQVSVIVRLDPKVKAAIAAISDDAWTPIEYTDAIFDETTGQWISRAEVAETPFTAFTSKKAAEQVEGRLVVRRIPDLNPGSTDGQATLFDTWRFHAFFTTGDLDTVAATRPTADTPSSNKSTPTSKTPPWHICPRGGSPPTPPGWSWPSWPSTSPAPPPRSAEPRWHGPAPPPSAAP